MTPEAVEAFLQDVTGKAVTVSNPLNQFSYPRDPKDEPYVNLAIATGASYFVTWDKDLLDLMVEGKPEGKAFGERFQSLRVVTPVVFLSELTNEVAAKEGAVEEA